MSENKGEQPTKAYNERHLLLREAKKLLFEKPSSLDVLSDYELLRIIIWQSSRSNIHSHRKRREQRFLARRYNTTVRAISHLIRKAKDNTK